MKYYFKAIYLSLFSKSFYIDLIVNKKFFGILYILLISFVVSIPVSMKFKNEIEQVFDFSDKYKNSPDAYSDEINSQLPKIFYNNGKFIIDTKSVSKMSLDSASYFIIFDPKNEIKNYLEFPNSIIINQDKMVYNYKNNDLKTFTPDKVYESFMPYFQKQNSDTEFGFLFDGKKFFTDVGYFLNFSYPVILFFTFFITSLKYLVWVFLFSNVAFFIFYAKLKPFTLPNRSFFRLSSFTVTAVVLFELIRVLFGIENLFMYPVIISVVINVIYLNFIADSFKKTLNYK